MGLHGRLIVVVGGAGAAGESVASGLLRSGATVAITSRSQVRVAEVQQVLDHPRLHAFCGPMDSLAEAATLRGRIEGQVGPIDGVVASLGGWWEGPPLTRLDKPVWDQIVNDNLTSHFVAARTFLPALAGRPETVYVMLGGVGATKPIPHAGPISVTGAAQTALLRVLAAEQTGVRLHEVRIMTPIVTRHWDRGVPEPGWLTGDEVGKQVADVLEPDYPRSRQLVVHLPEGSVSGLLGPTAAPPVAFEPDNETEQEEESDGASGQ